MTSLYRKIVINAASIYAARVFEGLLQLGIVAFILWRADRDHYAAALLVLSLNATIDLGRGGIQKATLKFIAEHRARKDYAAANGVLSTSVAMQGTVGLLGLLACLVVAPFSSTLFALPEGMRTEAQWATVFLGFSVFASFALSPWRNALAAMERYDLVSLIHIGSRVLRAVLIFSLLMADVPALFALVMSYGISDVVENFACILFNKKIDQDLRFKVRLVSRASLKGILTFSLFDLFHTISGFLYLNGSLFLATHLISLKAVAALGIIGNITALLGMVMSQYGQLLVPLTSRLNADGDARTIRALVVRGSALTVFLGGIVMTGLVPWMGSFLLVWLGDGLVAVAPSAIIMMCAAFLFSSLTCIHNPLAGMGKVALDGMSNTVCTAVGMSVGVVLVVFHHLGLEGLVVGLLLARILRFAVVVTYGAKVFGIGLGELLWKSYLRTFALVGAICAAAILIDLQTSTWPSVILAGATTAAVFFTPAFFWIVDRKDRSKLFEAIGRMRVSISRRR